MPFVRKGVNLIKVCPKCEFPLKFYESGFIMIQPHVYHCEKCNIQYSSIEVKFFKEIPVNEAVNILNKGVNHEKVFK